MTAVAKIEENAPVAIGDSLLEVIAKAARDPSVDIDKMERLIAMQERIHAREAEVAFNQAMNAAQAAMRPVSADATNPQTSSDYATFAALDKALRPIYTSNGFSLSFDEGESPKPEHVRVLCYVSHVAGHTRTYHRDMPADGKGAKGGDVMTKTHAAGAAGSYGARYLLKGIFNVAVGDDDSDGNDTFEPMPDHAHVKIMQLIEATNTNVQTMFKALGIRRETLKDLSPVEYEKAIDALETKLARMAKADTDAKAQANA